MRCPGRHRFAPLVVALALRSLLAADLRAQVPPTLPDTVDRWKVAIDLGFNGSSGNSSLAVFTTGFGISHLQTDLLELEWTSAFRYGESEGEVVARAIRSSVSADYRPEARWSPFVFSQFERDTFRKLDVLTNVGAGVKRTFVRTDAAELSLSAAVLHQYENFTQPRGAAALESETDARWSIRARGSRALGEAVRIAHTTFYKPVWDKAGDYAIDALTALDVRLGERIGLKFSHSFRRDSTPPPDVEKDDHVVQVGLTLEL